MGFEWKLGIPVWKHFLLGTDFDGGRKNKHNFYVVNVNKKRTSKNKFKCFEEAFLHSHDCKILSDFMTIHICFSIERQRKTKLNRVSKQQG